MQNKLLIFAIIAFFIIGSAYVSFLEVQKNDLSRQNTWMLYFNKPADNSLDFTIENHSGATDFRYEIVSGKNVLKSADVHMKNNQITSIPVSLGNADMKKVTVRVSDGTGSKEIYKNF